MEGDPNVSAFWMATDPDHPGKLLEGGKRRNGKFSNYHDLRLYYVGMGVHNNHGTRLRRHFGDGTRRLPQRYNRNGPLLKGDQTMYIPS